MDRGERFSLADKMGIDPSIKRIYIDNEMCDIICRRKMIFDEYMKRASGRKQPFKKFWLEIGSECKDDGHFGMMIEEKGNGLWQATITNDRRKSNSDENKLPFELFYSLLVSSKDRNFSKNMRILRTNEGSKPLNWFDDDNEFYQSMVLLPNYGSPIDDRILEDFLNGKVFLKNLTDNEQQKILAHARSKYHLGSIWLQAYDMIENGIASVDVIPPTPNPRTAGAGIIGDYDHIIKLSITPKHIIKAPIVGTGTPQRRHTRYGHYRHFGDCPKGIIELTNMCDERFTLDPNKSYCQICAKRLTWVEDYRAGRNRKGKINQSYDVVR